MIRPDGLRDSILAVASGLRLPLPTRTRLLRELRDDLEGLSAALEARGAPPEEARRRAAEALLPDTRVLRALERQKAPLYLRLTGGKPAATLLRAERWALVVATVGFLALEAVALLRAGLMRDPSPFLLPVLALGAVTLVAVAAKAFQLWVKGAYQDPSSGLTAIAGLCVLTLMLAFAGVVVDLTLLAGVLETMPDDATALLTSWLNRSAALLSAAIILSVASGLGWLALRGWTTHAEAAHQEALRDALSASALAADPHQPVQLPTKETPS